MARSSGGKPLAPRTFKLLFLVLFALGCRGQERTADADAVSQEREARLFAALAGVWEGTLEYADFSDDSRSRIPVIVEIMPLESPESARLRFKFVEPSGDTIKSEETHQLNRQERTYTVNGESFTVAEISGFTTPEAGELVWVGTEVENGQEVSFRQTIRLRADTLTVQKDTRTPLRFRNGLRLQRRPS